MNQDGGPIEYVFAGDDVVTRSKSMQQGERGGVAGRECKSSLAFFQRCKLPSSAL
jgi:hypothetical protein